MALLTPDRSSASTHAVLRRLHADIAAATGIAVPLRLWDGTRLGPADAPFELVLHEPAALRGMLLPPNDLAAGEAYVRGDLDIEGDVIAALELAARLTGAEVAWWRKAALAARVLRLPSKPETDGERRARLEGRRHTPERDREAIAFHYDLGNDFYHQFLDRQLVYSCAYFADPDQDLDAAQARKLDLVCRKLRLQPGDRFLDIGCGWGSLLLHAAREYGVRGLGVTLSEQQAELANERIAAAGLRDRLEVRLADYRELSGEFDAIASVGMFEHVGPDHLDGYFSTVWRLTADGGRFLNHGITTGNRDVIRDLAGAEDSFIGTYVFPDGGLVPAWEAARHMERAGFELIDVEQLRPHYALTLRHWVQRLEANHDEVVRTASETDYRIWRAYMAGSVVGFESGDLGVVQVLGSRGADLPLGRAWMLTH